MALNRLNTEGRDFLKEAGIEFERASDNGGRLVVAEETATYKVRKKAKALRRKK